MQLYAMSASCIIYVFLDRSPVGQYLAEVGIKEAHLKTLFVAFIVTGSRVP